MMKRRALISGFAGLLMTSAVSGEAFFVEEVDGVTFKEEFVALIKGAQKIRITEHSWDGDLPAGGAPKQEVFVYKTLELTPELKAKLLAGAEGMEAKPLIDPKRCDQPHHSIEFTDAAGKTCVMQVCFECSRISGGDMTAVKLPAAVFPLLEDFLEKEDFHAERDWKALAVEALAKKKAGG